MIYKTYGQTGKKVSAVGFGGMRFDMTCSLNKNAELVRYAFDKGINFFDTAPLYCDDKSEDIFGIALKQLARQRDKVYICTKGFPETNDTAEKAVAAVEKSLKRLNVDKIDFYYVWCIRSMKQYRLAMQKGGQYEGLLKCKQQGRLDHIVVSTHLRGEEIETIVDEGCFDGILIGMNILNFPYRWSGAQAAYRAGIGVVAMNPLAGGIIPKYEKQLGFLAGPGQSPTQAALEFLIGCPQITVALNGFSRREQIDMACRCADECRALDEKQINEIRAHISENLNSLCTGCGYCMKSCPKKIPIAAYMQFYNDKLLQDRSDEKMIKELAEQKIYGILVDVPAQAKDCLHCRRCEEACTQHLNIIERLDEIARWEQQIYEKKL